MHTLATWWKSYQKPTSEHEEKNNTESSEELKKIDIEMGKQSWHWKWNVFVFEAIHLIGILNKWELINKDWIG